MDKHFAKNHKTKLAKKVLYFVPVPIGNLEDISLRAIKLLQKAQTIISEDPRQTGKLIQLLDLKTTAKYIQITKNQHFNTTQIHKELELLAKTEQRNVDPENEQIICVVSDAGTPGLSDPGIEIIQIAQQLNLKYTVLPGSNALVPAIVASGLIWKEFWFVGFLPIKKGRNKQWGKIATSEIPVVLYESVHRMEKFLVECKENLVRDREICIIKDISKLHEVVLRTKMSEIDSLNLNFKGEFVVIIGGKGKTKNANS